GYEGGERGYEWGEVKAKAVYNVQVSSSNTCSLLTSSNTSSRTCSSPTPTPLTGLYSLPSSPSLCSTGGTLTSRNNKIYLHCTGAGVITIGTSVVGLIDGSAYGKISGIWGAGEGGNKWKDQENDKVQGIIVGGEGGWGRMELDGSAGKVEKVGGEVLRQGVRGEDGGWVGVGDGG
ncbi:hypothetical protein TrRE_jg6, partial [Triparma retinervis]